jgi:Protein of unknown function (DUF2971).
MINLADSFWPPEWQQAHREQSQKIIDAFKRTFQEDNPPVLYHYSKTENLQSILNSNIIRASNIKKLNDNLEYDYGFNLAKKLIQEKDYDLDFKKILLAELNQYKKNYYQELYILSFSRDGDNLPLWKIYSDKNFKGYCLGFDYEAIDFDVADANKELNKIKAISLCHGNVIYKLEKQKDILYGLVDEFEKYYLTTKKESDDDFKKILNSWHWNELVNYFTLFKHPSFRWEEEYRIVYYVDEIKEPYLEVKLSYNKENGQLPLSEIRVAPKNKNPKAYIKLLFSDHANIDEVKIILSEIP